MAEFIAGFFTCYLLLSAVVVSRMQTVCHPEAPRYIRLASAFLTIAVALPFLVWHGSRRIGMALDMEPDE